MPPTDTYLEEISSQLPALQLLINLGWQYLSPEEALALRDGRQKHVVLTGVLEPWLAEHNAIDFKGGHHAFSAANLREAVERLVNEPFQSLLLTNARLYELLTLGTSLTQSIDGDRKSFDLHYRIMRVTKGETGICAEGRSVMVCFDYTEDRTIDVPANWRTALEELTGA